MLKLSMTELSTIDAGHSRSRARRRRERRRARRRCQRRCERRNNRNGDNENCVLKCANRG